MVVSLGLESWPSCIGSVKLLRSEPRALFTLTHPQGAPRFTDGEVNTLSRWGLWGGVQDYSEPGVMVHSFNPRTSEAEASGSL